jgi:GntR family transcriptional regulator, transcriptional repressor for pyruvate dehydrogenase complex
MAWALGGWFVSELNRASLADQVGERLLSMIRDEALLPGDRLPSESVLASQFGVSRPVIREALSHLKSLGIIGTQGGKQAVVRQVDARLPAIFFEYALSLKGADVLDLLEVRRGLEVQSVELAAARADAGHVERLRDLTGRMKGHLERYEIEAFVDLDVEFHRLIARSSGNALLVHLIEAIREPLRESVVVGLTSRRSSEEVLHIHRMHGEIVAAIADRDVELARAAMIEHFDKALVAIHQVRTRS